MDWKRECWNVAKALRAAARTLTSAEAFRKECLRLAVEVEEKAVRDKQNKAAPSTSGQDEQ